MTKENIFIISLLVISFVSTKFAHGQDRKSHVFEPTVIDSAETDNDSLIVMVHMTFVIDKQGFVKDAEVVKTECDSCDAEIIRDCEKEAMRTVNDMPRWTPKKTNGKYQEVRYNLPVRFALPKESITGENKN
jgi:hypothetical protein